MFLHFSNWVEVEDFESVYSVYILSPQGSEDSWKYLVGQDVDVVSHVFGFDLAHKAVLVLIALQTLRVGLLHDVHLGGGAERSLEPASATRSPRDGGNSPTSSVGLIFRRIFSAFSLSWRLSMMASRSFEALFYKWNVWG